MHFAVVYSACSNKTPTPIRAVQVADTYALATAAMHKLVVLQVHAYMADAAGGIEKNKIAFAELVAGNATHAGVLFSRRAWKQPTESIASQHLCKRRAIYSPAGGAAIPIAGTVPIVDGFVKHKVAQLFYRLIQQDGILELKG